MFILSDLLVDNNYLVLIIIIGQVNDLTNRRISWRINTIQPNLHLVKLILQETNLLLQSCDHGVLPNKQLRSGSSLMVGIVIQTIHHLCHTFIQVVDLR